MNTIPSTSKHSGTPYTIAGGSKPALTAGKRRGITLLLLNRGARVYRSGLLHDITRLGFHEIISVEGPPASWDVEELSRRFQNVRFLVLHKEATVGEQINLGMQEAAGAYVLVVWNDLKIQQVTVLSRVVEKLNREGVLAVVPVLQNQKQQIIPSIQVPAFYRKTLKILSLQPASDDTCTIFPFDFCGIYDRENFLLTGGFDYTIENSYWQKLDFGFRSYMWGSRIICHTGMQLRYTTEVPAEDTSPDEGYRRFFLKNLILRFEGDAGRIPPVKLLSYWFKSGVGCIQALKEFKVVRRWVELNKYRFKMDARSVTELWEMPES